jgi:hypothetical protein
MDTYEETFPGRREHYFCQRYNVRFTKVKIVSQSVQHGWKLEERCPYCDEVLDRCVVSGYSGDKAYEIRRSTHLLHPCMALELDN